MDIVNWPLPSPQYAVQQLARSNDTTLKYEENTVSAGLPGADRASRPRVLETPPMEMPGASGGFGAVSLNELLYKLTRLL